jgi:hypothetical protein
MWKAVVLFGRVYGCVSCASSLSLFCCEIGILANEKNHASSGALRNYNFHKELIHISFCLTINKHMVVV